MKVTRIDVRKVTYEDMTAQGYSYSTYLKAKNRAARVYVFPKGETLLENLEGRHARPTKAYRKEVLPSVLAAMGLAADVKARWSQTAGCACGCSPGFIIDDERGVEVFVDVEV